MAKMERSDRANVLSRGEGESVSNLLQYLLVPKYCMSLIPDYFKNLTLFRSAEKMYSRNSMR